MKINQKYFTIYLIWIYLSYIFDLSIKRNQIMKTYTINGFKIETVTTESCLRLHQYLKGDTITCQCKIYDCAGKTDAQMRLSLDKIYK